MNNKCDNINCIYHKTCLIDNYNREKRCTGNLSNKNPQSDKYEAITRGETICFGKNLQRVGL